MATAEGQPDNNVARDDRVFHTLDALRGVAALGVVVFHMSAGFAPLAAPGGYLAVDLFFIMSGAVLSHSYEFKFAAGMGTVAFMRARLIRLYPLYLLGTLLGIALAVASLWGRNSVGWDPISVSKAAAEAVFLIPNFDGRPISWLFPLNLPSWSLFMELLVNFTFVATWAWLTPRRLLAFCVIAGAVVGVTIAHNGSIHVGWATDNFGAGVARTLFGFYVGVLIARLVRQTPRVQDNRLVWIILAVFGVAIMGGPAGGFRTLWDAFCVLAGFPVLVYCAMRVNPGLRLKRIATFLGVTSYAAYVLHYPLAEALNTATRIFAAGHGAAFCVAIVFATSLFAAAWLVDRLIDNPVRHFLGRILRRPMHSSRVPA